MTWEDFLFYLPRMALIPLMLIVAWRLATWQD
jgi:hypothetical protein